MIVSWKRSLSWRILVDGLLTRALLAPVILAIFLIGVVFASTHPRTVHAIATPDSYGIYFKRVNIVTVDNQRLTGWFIPPVTERQMARTPKEPLPPEMARRGPLPWLGAPATTSICSWPPSSTPRGSPSSCSTCAAMGESDPAVVTYGLRERLDVLAGVKFLRENHFVDETKVCIVGHDIGATAALQAASLDSSITAVVADGLWPKFEDRARDIFSRPSSSGSAWSNSATRLPTSWLAPLYTLAFEIAVRDRLNQLDPTAAVRSIHTQPNALFVARRHGPPSSPPFRTSRLWPPMPAAITKSSSTTPPWTATPKTASATSSSNPPAGTALLITPTNRSRTCSNTASKNKFPHWGIASRTWRL